MNKISKITLAVLLSTMVGSVGAMQFEDSDDFMVQRINQIQQQTQQEIAKVKRGATWNKQERNYVLSEVQKQLIAQIEQNAQQQIAIAQMQMQKQPKAELRVHQEVVNPGEFSLNLGGQDVENQLFDIATLLEGEDNQVIDSGTQLQKAFNLDNLDGSFEQKFAGNVLEVAKKAGPRDEAIRNFKNMFNLFKNYSTIEQVRSQFIVQQRAIIEAPTVSGREVYSAHDRDVASRKISALELEDAIKVLANNKEILQNFMSDASEVENVFNQNQKTAQLIDLLKKDANQLEKLKLRKKQDEEALNKVRTEFENYKLEKTSKVDDIQKQLENAQQEQRQYQLRKEKLLNLIREVQKERGGEVVGQAQNIIAERAPVMPQNQATGKSEKQNAEDLMKDLGFE